MTNNNETALILEGGGTRGVFTSGVLDCLMKHQIEFPYVTGVSAGACNAVDYVSGQIGRTKACVITEDKNNSYIGLKQTLKNKTLFDMDMLFERYPNEIFPFDYDAYFKEMEEMKEKYKGQITLKTGIEFGIQTHTTKAYEETFRQHPFDFVIFSCHQVENKEYWRQEPQEGKTQLEYNRRYYQEILDVVKVYKDYSILGHLDVIKRYDKQGEIEFEKIQDLIEQIYEVVIADGKGIELNTSSRAYKLKSLMPSKEILKLYHDMGGKIITIGSDAHNADRIGDCVMESQKILKDIGFDGIYTFEKMKPEFHRF